MKREKQKNAKNIWKLKIAAEEAEAKLQRENEEKNVIEEERQALQ